MTHEEWVIALPRLRREWSRASRWRSAYRGRIRKAGFEPVDELITKEQVIATYGDGCFYCVEGPFRELDHFVPITMGGWHLLENVRPSCRTCNVRKGG